MAHMLHQAGLPILILPSLLPSSCDEVLDNWRDHIYHLSEHRSLLRYIIQLLASREKLEFDPTWSLHRPHHPPVPLGSIELRDGHIHSYPTHSTSVGSEHESCEKGESSRCLLRRTVVSDFQSNESAHISRNICELTPTLQFSACVASLVRLGKTPVLRSSLNSTWNISTIAVWA